MNNDQAVIERLQDAVSAYTSTADGRPDSLDALLSRPTPQRSRRRTFVPMTALATGVAAAVVAVLMLATSLRGPAGDVQPLQRPGVGALLRAVHVAPGTSERFPAGEYFVTRHVTKLSARDLQSEPAIARTADLKIVRILPRTMISARLTADGSRLFGFYIAKNVWTAAFLDFATGDLVQIGTAPFPGITGMTVTPDGRTVAYSRLVKSDGAENTVIRVYDLRTSRSREFTVPQHRQSLKLALSPDATKLAFTETDSGNILFLANLSDPDPAASAVAVTPPQPCPSGAYDYPTWLDSGLSAAQECDPNAQGMVSQVVRLDPQTLRPAGAPLAPLPDGGVTSLDVMATSTGLEFGYTPVRSATPFDNGNDLILFHNNEEWLIKAGDHAGHRTGLLWSQ